MELYPKTKGANGFSNGCGMTAPVNKKKGKCIRGKDTEQRNGYGLQGVNAITQNCEKASPKIKKGSIKGVL